MPGNFAAALSSEMRRELKHEINTLSDGAMADFKRKDPTNYNTFMELVNDLLLLENEHGQNVYEDSFDEEHFIVTPNNGPRETIYDVQYNGRPLSTMFDSMKGASADALVKSVRNARFAKTATTFSFDSPAELEHRPESEYRSNGVFCRDQESLRIYKPGRWASDWENAPSPEPSPKVSPVSSAETTPETREFMATLDARWNIATINALRNRREGMTEPMDNYEETNLRHKDDAENAAAKKARRVAKANSKTFLEFIDSLPDPAKEADSEEDLKGVDEPGPSWSLDALDDVSAVLSEKTQQHSSKVPTRSREDFLNLQDNLANGLGEIHLTGRARANPILAEIKVADKPPRTLRRVTAKIPPR